MSRGLILTLDVEFMIDRNSCDVELSKLQELMGIVSYLLGF